MSAGSARANSAGGLERERERVAAASRRLAERGLVLGTAGNVSERSGELVAITPTGAVLEHVDAEQIAVVDVQGAHVSGPLEPTSELELHLGAYRRYECGAVVHVHSPVATALSCVLEELPVLHYQQLALGGAVRVAPYRTFGTPELAEATLDALEGRSAALMANHGTIVHGPDLDTAVERAVLLEWSAELYWRAVAVGAPRTLTPEQLLEVVENVSARGRGTTRELPR